MWRSLVDEGDLPERMADVADKHPGAAEPLTLGVQPGHLRVGELTALWEQARMRVVDHGRMRVALPYPGRPELPTEWVVASR